MSIWWYLRVFETWDKNCNTSLKLRMAQLNIDFSIRKIVPQTNCFKFSVDHNDIFDLA